MSQRDLRNEQMGHRCAEKNVQCNKSKRRHDIPKEWQECLTPKQMDSVDQTYFRETRSGATHLTGVESETDFLGPSS